MYAWQEDDIQSLLAVPDENELFERLTRAAQDLGFEYCAYGLRMPLPLSNPRVAMFNNYPRPWQERYQACGYVTVDPTVQHGMRSSLPVVWSDEVFASAPQLWDEARAFGLRVGWALAYRDASGVRSLMTLSRSRGELTRDELDANLPRLYWLTQVGHIGMTQLMAPKLMPEIRVRLSEREAEVLRWTADGKTSNDVAEILGISERTVNFHINNAMAKLGATNKTSATIRAAMLGLL
ncbi:MAG TPA: autoinducer binding domain-containing protein [Burkholderiaceae bacterium]|nr:autoinducer binding domain-containing protein [Burkholderiaceae bacterium]